MSLDHGRSAGALDREAGKLRKCREVSSKDLKELQIEEKRSGKAFKPRLEIFNSWALITPLFRPWAKWPDALAAPRNSLAERIARSGSPACRA